MLPKYNHCSDTCPNVLVPEAPVPKVLLVCHWGHSVNSKMNHVGRQVGHT